MHHAELRRDIERAPDCPGAILFHSISGGTGSGFGCRMALAARRLLGPTKTVVSVTVAGFDRGSPLQHINTVLSAASLASTTDVSFVFSNEELMSGLLGGSAPPPSSVDRAIARYGSKGRERGSGSGRSRDDVSIDDINTRIARAYRAVTAPWGPGAPFDWNMLRGTGFCKIYHAVDAGGDERKVRRVVGGLMRSCKGEAGKHVMAVSRGAGFGGFQDTIADLSGIETSRVYAASVKSKTAGGVAIVSAVKQSNLFADSMRRTRALVDAGAFIHWYKRHGTTADDIRYAVESLLE